MPRLFPLISNFTSGELSPKVHLGRVDFARYNSGLETLENWLVYPQGGVTRRPGSRRVATVGNTARVPRLVPFVFSASTAYMLEFGHLYIRIYTNSAQVTSGGAAVEITTTYAESDLFALDVSGQSADVLYITHSNYAPAKLLRYSDTIWKLRTVSYVPPPSFEFGHRPAGTLTPGATSGDNVTFTSSLNDFQGADVDRELLITGGGNGGARAGIKSFTNATTVVGTICDAFVDVTANTAANWKITGSPLVAVAPGASTPVGLSTTLTATANAWKGVVGGNYQTGDCSKFVLLNGGMYQITAVTSLTVLQALIRGTASGITSAPAGAWSLEEGAWSTQNGFPQAVNPFEDRFYYGGTTAQADTLWGTKVADYENMGFGTVDDDAVAFTLNSAEVNGIRWIRGMGKGIAVGTAGGEFIGSGGADNPITPTNVLFRAQTSYGSALVAPLRVGNVVLFLTRSKKKIRELVFSFEEDSYKANDLTILAEHLTCSGTITQMAYQQDPDSIIWAVRSDGQLLAGTYLRDEKVMAWAREKTRSGDTFESVAVIPHPDGDRDQVWVATKRTVNGATTRFIEYFDDAGQYYRTLNVDCGMTCDTGSTSVKVGGLGYLECESVVFLGDGAVYPAQIVVDGEINVDPAAQKVEVGLAYTSTLKTVRPEVATGAGTMQAMKVRWAEIKVRLLRSLGLTVQGEVIPFRKAGDPMDSPPPLFTGDKQTQITGWEDNNQITITQTQPLPATVVLITGILDVGSG